MNNSFVFYASFLETIDKLKSAGENDLANKVLNAIVEIGIYGEYTGGDVLVESYLPTIQVGIEKATKRYESASNGGKKGGREKLYSDEEIVKLRLEGYTNAQITKMKGCSMKTCQRAWKKYETGQLDLGDTTGQNWDITFCRVEETMGQNSDKSDTTILSREGSMDITATKLVSALQSEATNDDISDKTELSPIDYTKDFVF